MTLPKTFTLSARMGESDDWTDIEMRSETEKYTIASVEDRFAPLFLAAPDMLAALEAFEDEFRSRLGDIEADLISGGPDTDDHARLSAAIAAIAKATRPSP
jgi:hypothetical protein